jgi:hypothetical protein
MTMFLDRQLHDIAAAIAAIFDRQAADCKAREADTAHPICAVRFEGEAAAWTEAAEFLRAKVGGADDWPVELERVFKVAVQSRGHNDRNVPYMGAMYWLAVGRTPAPDLPRYCWTDNEEQAELFSTRQRLSSVSDRTEFPAVTTFPAPVQRADLCRDQAMKVKDACISSESAPIRSPNSR